MSADRSWLQLVGLASPEVHGMRAKVCAVIEACGGLRALSRELGHANPTTVQGWKERGVVPTRQIPLVVAVARKRGLNITAADFFETA